MIKKIIPLLFIFLLTGCYDYKELNTISIISATTINKINNEYIVTTQAINPQAPDKTTTIQAPFIIYSGTGKTLQEAYRMITSESSRFLYSSHLQILLIDETLAKENLEESLDFFLRNPAIRTEFYVLLTKNIDTMNIVTPIDELSALSIKESLEINKLYLGTSCIVTFNELVNTAINPNKEIILPVIELTNDKQIGKNIKNTEDTQVKTKYKLNNLAIFKDNKLKGYLNANESFAYNIIENNIKNTIINYECKKDKYISTEITNSKSNIKIDNNTINIDISMTGIINESNCQINLDNNKEFKKVKTELENDLSKKIKDSINNIRNTYNSDIFGFLDIIYKNDTKRYNKIKDNWYKDIYKNLEIKVKTNIDVTSKGNALGEPNEKNK